MLPTKVSHIDVPSGAKFKRLKSRGERFWVVAKRGSEWCCGRCRGVWWLVGGGFCGTSRLLFFRGYYDAHSTSLCPVLADIYYGLEMCRGSRYKYLVEGSNPVKVVD